MGLFFVALVILSFKWWQLRIQLSLTTKASGALAQLVSEGSDVPSAGRSEWLAANWLAQPVAWQSSWFGQRIREIVDRQVMRGKRSQVEMDMRSLADADADRQHDSYGLVRIITWAMPMLGFLGTVLGISQTLGQLDTKLLATQQQEAMNQITSGLYVAFDTTAIALVLTIVAIFIQYAISQKEVALLGRLDGCVQDNLIAFLGADPNETERGLLGPVRQMASDLIDAVRQLAVEQATVWSHSIAESQKQWSGWSELAGKSIQESVTSSLTTALENHARQFEKIQDAGSRQIDTRSQQWQTTLSDHARSMLAQQKEMTRQTETLEKLVASTCELKKLEDVVQDNIAKFSQLDQLQEAAICIGEAVAVLATSLERAGVIRGAPVKPRQIRKFEAPAESPNSHAREAA